MGSLVKEFEEKYWALNKVVVGVDEAGRGPMAGPCVVCGVILPIGYINDDINDSKALSIKKRNDLRNTIEEVALWYSYRIIDVQTIDRDNIYKATQDAMQDIVNSAPADIALTDAMPLLESKLTYESLIKGDARSQSIAAASILAKTYRDDIMIDLDKKYPEYGFAKHKGYGTKAHKEAILKFGRTPEHRQSFRFKDENQISLDI